MLPSKDRAASAGAGAADARADDSGTAGAQLAASGAGGGGFTTPASTLGGDGEARVRYITLFCQDNQVPGHKFIAMARQDGGLVGELAGEQACTDAVVLER
jgi:hypothetical protein